MQSPIVVRLFVLFAVSATFSVGARLARADDPCASFTWDVRHERTLFGEQPQSVAAGQTLAAAPAVVIDHLYELKLTGQAAVTFVTAGKTPKSDEAYAGLVRLTVKSPGIYRISLDQPVWVDLIANGTVVAAKDHQGSRGCSAPHKIVEFLLPAGVPVTLQFSAANVATTKLAVTRSPDQSGMPRAESSPVPNP
jgi:hypothetical protein